MLKVVLDTNIIISGLLFGGKPQKILELVIDKKIEGFISRFIINEVCEVLRKKFNFSSEDTARIEILIRKSFVLINPDFSLKIIKNQSFDNHILEAAIAAQAEYLISGDTKHLLPLKKIKKTKIVSAKDFLFPTGNSFSCR
jgi:putative PIN family toxin of toxin-antitoxin system